MLNIDQTFEVFFYTFQDYVSYFLEHSNIPEIVAFRTGALFRSRNDHPLLSFPVDSQGLHISVSNNSAETAGRARNNFTMRPPRQGFTPGRSAPSTPSAIHHRG